MMEPKTICRVCNAEILVVTSNRTGGMCMPCFQGARYHCVAYLSIEDFFNKATGDHCLAPNLDPHPTNAAFQVMLNRIRNEPGVTGCIIPVNEYEQPEEEREPYSDRVFVIGSVEKKIIARWARRLKAGFYLEPRPGAELPLEHSHGQPVWCLVWD